MSEAEVATLGGGCFWCTEAVFDEIIGVLDVVPGYSGGKMPNPDYNQVCAGTSGHAEVVQVHFDPTVISYREILEVFFAAHDPTTLNRQGADVGTQYRSVIFYHGSGQKAVAQQVIHDLEAAWVFGAKIVTAVEPFRFFYPAEQFHKGFYKMNPTSPYCKAVITPKLAELRKKLRGKLKATA